jgi:hypothetical protein
MNNDSPKNFWTEHQYNVGLGNGKEIRCYGHKIADKKTMDDLLRKALQNMQYQATNNMNSPQLADDLKFKSLPESMKSNTPNMDKEVAQQNADKAIERVKNLAEEAKQKTDDLMKKADAGNKVESSNMTPSTPTIIEATVVASSALKGVAEKAQKNISETLDSIRDLTKDQLNNISGTATNTINEGRMTIRNLANKVGNWLKGSPSQAGGKKTRRRRKKRKRKTKHKRKKKKSTRKRKKRTRRRR